MTAHQLQQSLYTADAGSQEPDLTYVSEFVKNQEHWFEKLRSNLDWNNQYQSRKYHSFGVRYNSQSGENHVGVLPKFLTPVCDRIEQVFGYYPNNCLANYYPDGDHYISFHSDQDMDMTEHSGVTIVSLGAVRNMVLRRIDSHQSRFYYPLEPGSAFYMRDRIQKDWQHGVLKQAGAGPRISLSFRRLQVPESGQS